MHHGGESPAVTVRPVAATKIAATIQRAATVVAVKVTTKSVASSVARSEATPTTVVSQRVAIVP